MHTDPLKSEAPRPAWSGRHVFHGGLVLLATACLLTHPAHVDAADTAPTRRPNIVLIVADDLGWADVSLHGTQIQTPQIDSIAHTGAELERFYVCPVCSPTRAGLMTGRYPIRFGLMRAVIPPWRTGGLDLSETTLADVLGRAGYRHRGAFGKWHLGHSARKYHPLRRGFTEFVGHYNGAIDYFTHQREGQLDWHRNYATNRDSGYSTDLVAQAASEFIRRCAAQPQQPFFCYVPFNAPHGPLQAKPGDLKTYQHLATADGNNKQRFNKPRPGKPAAAYGAQGRGASRRQTLAAMISSLDQAVGRILKTLEETNAADNTLVWFLSDNGGVRPGDNRPLRGAKGTVFEGGIRVVSAVRWPGRIAPGGKIAARLAYIDVLPTLMRVAGIPAHRGKPLDGLDAWDVITGKQQHLPRDLYSYIGQQGEQAERIALAEPRWKLVINGPNILKMPTAARERLLFDLVGDPFEKNNLIAQHPDVVTRMTAKLRTFRKLQPKDAVLAYSQNKAGFQAPQDWFIPDAADTPQPQP